MALLQVQALLASLLAGIAAFCLGLWSQYSASEELQSQTKQQSEILEFLMVLCASMLAASASSGILSSAMCSLIVLSRYLGINPGETGLPSCLYYTMLS